MRAGISSGKTIRKKPQNKLARGVVRRKEKRKEKKNLLAFMVRRFFLIFSAESYEEWLARNVSMRVKIYFSGKFGRVF